MFVGYSICIFSFTAHTSVFMMKAELTNDIERRIKKIFFRSITFELILYLVTAYAGYFSVLDNTPELIITRPAIKGHKDYLMLAGNCGTLMLLLTSIVIIGSTCRK